MTNPIQLAKKISQGFPEASELLENLEEDKFSIPKSPTTQ